MKSKMDVNLKVGVGIDVNGERKVVGGRLHIVGSNHVKARAFLGTDSTVSSTDLGQGQKQVVLR